MGKPKGKAHAAEAGPTLAQVVTGSGLLEKIATSTRSIIARSVVEADEQGKIMLRVVSCHTCDAPKACCSLVTAVYLYEGLPIAARLVAEGRDTPELRAQLRARAEAMENAPRRQYRHPCVFLDAEERCTIYTDRPSTCGMALVYSPAAGCSDPTNKIVDAYRPSYLRELTLKVEEGVREELGLPRGAHLYMGVLPRVVLLCLQAWHRSDFVKFFSQHAPAAAAGLDRAVGG
ncbi:MAG TPA: YkgJ family cysteine cluster protein [Kofleriaceae bacterium]|nr:YkgJ family cysteine cluster protein [Kofleriaceae bacterium]